MIVNFYFKKDDQLLTFRRGNTKPQIEFFLTRANHRRMCKDYKDLVIGDGYGD